MPLRNVLRAPRRTVMTVLGIGAVVAIVFALAGVIDSFNATIDATRSETLAGSRQRLTVDLATPQPVNGPVVRAVTSAPSVGTSQPSLRLPVTLLAGGRHVDVFLEFTDTSGAVWKPKMRTGALASGRPSAALAALALEDLHVRRGQLVSVRYPIPTGPSSYQLTTRTLDVSAVDSSPLRYVAYANGHAATWMRLSGLTNRISVIPSPGKSAADVKRALLSIPAVTAVQGAAAGSDAISQTISQFTQVLLITVAIAVVMALLIAYNSAAINAEERTREHATMFAYGVRLTRVMRGNIAEALLTGSAATAIGLAAGYGILRWMLDSSMRNTMPDLGTIASISALTFALAALAGLISVTLAPLLTIRRVRRIDVPSALRVVE